MGKFRKWLIEKLDAIPREDCDNFNARYWKPEHVSVSLYVGKELYNEKTAASIERELATKIGEELLMADLLSFGDSFKADSHGDMVVYCHANPLRIRERDSCHMPTRLQGLFDKRRCHDE